MNTHTPGPWEVHEGEVTAADGDVNIADMVGRGDQCAVQNPNEAEANARLIAAAPDLFDIVRTIVAVCDSGDNNLASLACMETSPLVGAARAAIAKVVGK